MNLKVFDAHGPEFSQILLSLGWFWVCFQIVVLTPEVLLASAILKTYPLKRAL